MPPVNTLERERQRDLSELLRQRLGLLFAPLPSRDSFPGRPARTSFHSAGTPASPAEEVYHDILPSSLPQAGPASPFIDGEILQAGRLLNRGRAAQHEPEAESVREEEIKERGKRESQRASGQPLADRESLRNQSVEVAEGTNGRQRRAKRTPRLERTSERGMVISSREARQEAVRRRDSIYEARTSKIWGETVGHLLDNLSPEALMHHDDIQEQIRVAQMEAVRNLSEPLLGEGDLVKTGLKPVRKKERFGSRLPQKLIPDDDHFVRRILTDALYAADCLKDGNEESRAEATIMEADVSAVTIALMKIYSCPAEQASKLAAEAGLIRKDNEKVDEEGKEKKEGLKPETRAARDWMGIVDIPAKDYEELTEQAEDLFGADALKCLNDSGLLSDEEIMIIYSNSGGDKQVKKEEIRVELGELLRDEERRESVVGAAEPVLQARYSLYSQIGKRNRHRTEDWPALAVIAADALLKTLSRHAERLNQGRQDGEITEEKFDIATTALTDFRAKVISLKDACEKSLAQADEMTGREGRWLEQNDRIETDFRANMAEADDPTETMTNIYPAKDDLTSVRFRLYLAAHPGAGRFVPPVFDKEGNLLDGGYYEVASKVAGSKVPVDSMVVDALERLQQKTNAIGLANGDTGIAHKNLPVVMDYLARELFGVSFNPAKHSEFLPGEGDNRPVLALDGGVRVEEVFYNLTRFAASLGIIDEHEGFNINPAVAASFHGFVGNRLAHLDALPEVEKRRYMVMLSYGPATLGDFQRVYGMADREHRVSEMDPVEVEKKRYPSKPDVVKNLSTNFTGGNQQVLIDETAEFFDDVAASIVDTHGGDWRLARRSDGKVVPMKPNKWINGPTGVGKSKVVGETAAKFGIKVIELPGNKLVGRRYKGYRIGVGVYEGLKPLADEIGWNAAKTELEEGRIVLVVDEIDTPIEQVFRGGDSGNAAKELLDEILALTGDDAYIDIEGPEQTVGMGAEIMGRVSVKRIPVIVMGALEEGQVQAKIEYAEKTGDKTVLKERFRTVPIDEELLEKLGVSQQILGRFAGAIVNVDSVSRKDYEAVLKASQSRRHPMTQLRQLFQNWLEREGSNDVVGSFSMTDGAVDLIVDWLSDTKRRRFGYRKVAEVAKRLNRVLKDQYREGALRDINGRVIIVDEELVSVALE